MNKGQHKIEDVCRKFKKDMQRLVDKKGAGITKISISLNGGEKILIAERKEQVK